jgi:hypothetical protein
MCILEYEPPTLQKASLRENVGAINMHFALHQILIINPLYDNKRESPFEIRNRK